MTHCLPSAQLIAGRLQFAQHDGFARARRLGALYLKQPENLDFSAGIALANNYYREPSGGPDDDYRGFPQRELRKSLLGYSNTGDDQNELLQIECRLWREYLPPSVCDLLWAMNDLNREALLQLFAMAGVSPAHIDIITGGLSNNDSLQYCIFNHYRSETKHPLGLTAHKDSGFSTLLYTTTSGLESWHDGRWIPLDPLPGHFTLVLGHAFEVLTEKMHTPVNASYHRVRKMPELRSGQADRFSFGSYLGPRWDQDLYQYDGETLRAVQSVVAFQRQKAAEMAYEFHPKIERARDGGYQ